MVDSLYRLHLGIANGMFSKLQATSYRQSGRRDLAAGDAALIWRWAQRWGASDR